MKKTLLALALFSTCLCACNERKISESVSVLSSTNISNDTSSIQHVSSSSEVYERPDDWYTPRYYDDFKEPRAYGRLLEFNYQDEVEQKRLFEYLATIEDGKYVSKFPVPFSASLEPDPNAAYTSSYYNCCKEEYTRISLGSVFEIDDPYYMYGMEMDWYGIDIFHIKVYHQRTPDVILEKYYKMYTNEELTIEQVQSYAGSSHWKNTGHWEGNFVPDQEYRSCKKFDINIVFYLCTRMFFTYDKDRNLNKVRIYEKTPSSSVQTKIVGLE